MTDDYPYDDHYRLLGIYTLFVIAILSWLLLGCAMPVETVHTEIVRQTDTVHQTDSIEILKEVFLRETRPEDSLAIARLGLKLQENERLLILTQRELQKAKSTTYESHNKDSVRADTIRVPYPVERSLTKWETFCIDYGKVMLGVTLVLISMLIFIIYRWLAGHRR